MHGNDRHCHYLAKNFLPKRPPEAFRYVSQGDRAVSPKIEKIWGTVFGQTAIKRREAPVEDSLNAKQEGHPRKDSSSDQQASSDDQSEQNQEKTIDRAALEKAIGELKAAEHFAHTGMRAEIIESGPTLFVRFIKATGEIVKMMSADEFMKLNKGSSREDAPRGKILDQKF